MILKSLAVGGMLVLRVLIPAVGLAAGATSCVRKPSAPPPSAPAPSIALSDRPADEPLRERIPAFYAAGERMEDVLGDLGDMAGLRLDVRWAALREANVTPDTLVDLSLRNVPARRALQAAIDAAGRAAGVAPGAAAAPVFDVRDDGSVLVTTRQDLFPTALVQREYDVADMLHAEAGPETPREVQQQLVLEIVSLVTETVVPESWATGGPAGPAPMIAAAGTMLTVVQTHEYQRQVAKLLDDVRSARVDRDPGASPGMP
jgi:hypothetical protein